MLNKIIKEARKLDFLLHIIRRGKTGCAEKIAEKTNTSRRGFFVNIDDLREHGIPIEYCKEAESYVFQGEVKFLFEVTVNGEKIVQIKGGRKNNYDFL